MSDDAYEETIFEFSDGQWWSIEEDPGDIGYEYEVPFTKDPAKMWTRIDHMKRNGWKVKNPPESSDRIVLFKGTPPVSNQGDVS